MFNEILESCKNDLCWCKNWYKTRNKKTGSCILQLFTKAPSQNLWLAFHAAWYCPLRMGSIGGRGGSERWRGLYLKIKTCSAWRKSFANDPLVTGCFHLNSKFILKSSSPVRRCKNFMWYQALCLGTQTSPVNKIVLFHVISC